MGDVIDMTTRSSARLKTCRCGSQWWDAVVSIEADGSVGGYSNDRLRCHECGERSE